jgi:hypothetical protein
MRGGADATCKNDELVRHQESYIPGGGTIGDDVWMVVHVHVRNFCHKSN